MTTHQKVQGALNLALRKEVFLEVRCNYLDKSLILACLKSLWYNTGNYIALAALLSREVEGPAL